jgi:hypothetical protein
MPDTNYSFENETNQMSDEASEIAKRAKDSSANPIQQRPGSSSASYSKAVLNPRCRCFPEPWRTLVQMRSGQRRYVDRSLVYWGWASSVAASGWPGPGRRSSTTNWRRCSAQWYPRFRAKAGRPRLHCYRTGRQYPGEPDLENLSEG